MARLRTDVPSWRRYFYFPTLLHIRHDDEFLEQLLYIGGLGGLVLVWSGVCSPLGLGLAWAVYVSYVNTLNLIYPWDCLLSEMGFLSLFLPPLHLFTDSWSLCSAPAPLLSFSTRFLAFRLMFGQTHATRTHSEARQTCACHLICFAVNVVRHARPM